MAVSGVSNSGGSCEYVFVGEMLRHPTRRNGARGVLSVRLVWDIQRPEAK